ncbi:hypothetical protein [Kamptonema formosum]|uniref:hypothetical protein n=1 Tax=Kamptonema formosum TaxID=331992 RepID=UPI000346F3D4|nr:hypothetical protein [Oscillatoria sp. PCC 10802]
MFDQFRDRYSTGCLISELVTIYQGKYVVRALVTVEGATLASGLAAAETLEQAEDQARIRALAVLGILPNAAEKMSALTGSHTPALPVQPQVKSSFQLEKSFSADPLGGRSSGGTQKTSPPAGSAQKSPLTSPAVSPAAPAPPPPATDNWYSSADPTRLWVPPASGPDFSESLPFTDMETALTGEPSDLSDALAKIEVTLKRLRVSSKQEQDFLERTYGKSELALLDETEVQQFLEYLEVYDKTSDEINRLGWRPDEGKAYLQKAYGKEGRIQLTREQLDEFLKYLKTQ